jgi:uncharacterized phosphosugar-binding protein
MEQSLSPSQTYLETAHSVLNRIDTESVRRAAGLIADSIAAGGVVHLFGSGHSSLLAQEVFYRAGGLMAINPILDPRLGFEKGAVESTEFERSLEGAQELSERAGFQGKDAGIVISNSGRNALPVEMALRMKQAGMTVIALTNLDQSRSAEARHPSGKRLFEVADAILDNHCPSGDAAVHIPGIPHAIGPLSTVVGAAILHSVLLEAAANLVGKGISPGVLASANVGNVTPASMRQVLSAYAGRIRYYREGGR